MSITNSDLVSDALREIGVLDETETASAEQFADGIKKLNQMMELMEVGGIRLDYFKQSISSDNCPIPVYAETGITCTLAMRLAATYRATVTAELAATAEGGMRVILREAVKAELPVATMQNRPRGTGDHRFFDITQLI